MTSLCKKQVLLAALTSTFLLVLIALIMVPAPVPHALQVSILGQTNDASGAALTLVSVANHTGQARIFYLSTMVPCPSGWTSANQRCQKRDWLEAHSECQVLLLAPPGAARWKFSCMSRPEVSKPEWLWYRLIRGTGLSRVGFRDQAPASYVLTTEIGL